MDLILFFGIRPRKEFIMLGVTFDVNHKVLKRGIYIAKLDTTNEVTDVTIDIRLRRPYCEPPMTESEMHTFEHAYASAIRAAMDDKEDARVIYFGPMGCNTGFYLIFQIAASDEVELESVTDRLPRYMLEAVDLLGKMKHVPANHEYLCGNYKTLGDMAMVRRLGEDLRALLRGVKMSGWSQYTRIPEDLCEELEDAYN